MREDYSTHTEADAAAYERHHIEPDYGDDRPTLAELQRDEADDDVDWNVAVSEHLPARPGESS
jgi:hypothetical protein